MSIWLLGNLTLGTVTSHSYMEMMAELLEISENTVLLDQCPSARGGNTRDTQPLSLRVVTLAVSRACMWQKIFLIKMRRSV